MIGKRILSHLGIAAAAGLNLSATVATAQVANVTLIGCGGPTANCNQQEVNNQLVNELNTVHVPQINANVTNIATNAANIATNAANTATNTTDIATNTASIATNTANIATLMAGGGGGGGASAAAVARNTAEIADVRSDLSKGIAVSNAMNVFLPDPDKNYVMSVGLGYYGDNTAIGVTGSGRISSGTSYFFGIGSAGDSDSTGAKAGLVFQW